MVAQKTPLYESHLAHGGHMVEFAHTLLPVRYVSEHVEHDAVRSSVGVFDISHMGELFVRGADALSMLQYALTNNVEKLAIGHAHYTLMLNSDGGIIDDLIVYRLGEREYLLCVNAANIETDVRHIKNIAKKFNCEVHNASDSYGLLALQGPRAAALLSTLCEQPLPQRFCILELRINTINVLAARTGYTGEDGFEIFIKKENLVEIFNLLLDHGRSFDIKPCGLAARDSLRLEAGLMLHGQDIDETTTPLEASLMFAVALHKKEFIGKAALSHQKSNGIKRKLIGFKLLDRGLARHGYNVIANDGASIGVVTSAGYNSLNKLSFGLAYVEAYHARNGEEVFISIRDRPCRALVCKTRFLAT